MMYANVDAPEANAVPGGLASLANVVPSTDDRWIAGYQYVPEADARVARNRSPLTSTLGDNIGSDEDPGVVKVNPWMLEIEVETSAVNHATDIQGQGRRLMEAYTSRLLERELWLGEIAQEDDLPNPYLTKTGATEISGSFTDPVKAVRALVAEGAVVIHVPFRIGLELPLELRNDESLGLNGFVVVSGIGYPDGNRIYGTGLVNVRLAEIEVTPPNFNEAFDRRDNTIRYTIRRYGAADFSGPVLTCTVTL